MKFIFLNLSNHPCVDWSDHQIQEAIKLAKSHLLLELQVKHAEMDPSDLSAFVDQTKIQIEDYPFPNIDPCYLGDLFEIAEMHIFKIKQKYKLDRLLCAMVMGEMSLTMAFLMMLQSHLPLYVSTAERVIHQKSNAEITKLFYFQRFRPYPDPHRLKAYQYFRANPLNLSDRDIDDLNQMNLKLPYHDISLAMSRLYFYRYQIVFKVDTELYLSEHIGNMIRGALGYALEQITCPNGNCHLHEEESHCLFRLIYHEEVIQHQRNYTRPFVLHPPQVDEAKILSTGEYLSFDFSLLGLVQHKWLQLVEALHNAFAKGIGKYQKHGKGVCHLYELSLKYPYQQILYYAPTSMSFPYWLKQAPQIEWKPCGVAYPLRPFKLRLKFLTPTRIKQNERWVLADELKLSEICRSIFRRIDGHFRQAFQVSPKFQYAYYEEICESLSFQIISAQDLSITHWSNRKARQLLRDGFIGEFEIEGERLYELAPLLWLGHFLNIGKNAMEGYGHYEIEG